MSTPIAPLPLANIEQWETRAVLKKRLRRIATWPN